jgi:hypothetical protein
MSRVGITGIAVWGLLVGGCGTPDTSYYDLVFASAETPGTDAGAGITNILFARLTAPTPGTLSASATGSCTVEAALPIGSYVVASLATSATDDTSQPGDAQFLLHEQDDVGSFSTQRTMAVPSGPQTIYLNVNNPSTGGTLGCSASLTLIFGSTSLKTTD